MNTPQTPTNANQAPQQATASEQNLRRQLSSHSEPFDTPATREFNAEPNPEFPTFRSISHLTGQIIFTRLPITTATDLAQEFTQFINRSGQLRFPRSDREWDESGFAPAHFGLRNIDVNREILRLQNSSETPEFDARIREINRPEPPRAQATLEEPRPIQLRQLREPQTIEFRQSTRQGALQIVRPTGGLPSRTIANRVGDYQEASRDIRYRIHGMRAQLRKNHIQQIRIENNIDERTSRVRTLRHVNEHEEADRVIGFINQLKDQLNTARRLATAITRQLDQARDTRQNLMRYHELSSATILRITRQREIHNVEEIEDSILFSSDEDSNDDISEDTIMDSHEEVRSTPNNDLRKRAIRKRAMRKRSRSVKLQHTGLIAEKRTVIGNTTAMGMYFRRLNRQSLVRAQRSPAHRWMADQAIFESLLLLEDGRERQRQHILRRAPPGAPPIMDLEIDQTRFEQSRAEAERDERIRSNSTLGKREPIADTFDAASLKILVTSMGENNAAVHVAQEILENWPISFTDLSPSDLNRITPPTASEAAGHIQAITPLMTQLAKELLKFKVKPTVRHAIPIINNIRFAVNHSPSTSLFMHTILRRLLCSNLVNPRNFMADIVNKIFKMIVDEYEKDPRSLAIIEIGDDWIPNPIKAECIKFDKLKSVTPFNEHDDELRLDIMDLKATAVNRYIISSQSGHLPDHEVTIEDLLQKAKFKGLNVKEFMQVQTDCDGGHRETLDLLKSLLNLMVKHGQIEERFLTVQGQINVLRDSIEFGNYLPTQPPYVPITDRADQEIIRAVMLDMNLLPLETPENRIDNPSRSGQYLNIITRKIWSYLPQNIPIIAVANWHEAVAEANSLKSCNLKRLIPDFTTPGPIQQAPNRDLNAWIAEHSDTTNNVPLYNQWYYSFTSFHIDNPKPSNITPWYGLHRNLKTKRIDASTTPITKYLNEPPVFCEHDGAFYSPTLQTTQQSQNTIETLNQFIKFTNSTTNNHGGIHIMIGLQAIKNILENHPKISAAQKGMIQPTIPRAHTTFLLQNASDLNRHPEASRVMPFVGFFIAYLASELFREDQNRKIEKGSEGAIMRACLFPPPTPDQPGWITFWSLEGLKKAEAFKDDKYIHIHIGICYVKYNGEPAGCCSNRIEKIMTYLTSVIGTSITTRAIRSTAVIKYMMKEFTLFATTRITKIEPSKESITPTSHSYSEATVEQQDLIKELLLRYAYQSTPCELCDRVEPQKRSPAARAGYKPHLIKHLIALESPLTKEFPTWAKYKDIIADSHISPEQILYQLVAGLNLTKRIALNAILATLKPPESIHWDNNTHAFQAGLILNTILAALRIYILSKPELYAGVTNYITQSIKKFRNREGSYKLNLLITGAGGTGKTMLATALCRAAQTDTPSQTLSTTINRTPDIEISYITLMDEAGATTRLNPVIEFVELEKATSKLFAMDTAKKLFTFNFIIRAGLKLPSCITFTEYDNYMNKNGRRHIPDAQRYQEYLDWKGQATRRFLLCELPTSSATIESHPRAIHNFFHAKETSDTVDINGMEEEIIETEPSVIRKALNENSHIDQAAAESWLFDLICTPMPLATTKLSDIEELKQINITDTSLFESISLLYAWTIWHIGIGTQLYDNIADTIPGDPIPIVIAQHTPQDANETPSLTTLSSRRSSSFN